MIANIVGAVIAAAVGLLIAFANYIFSKKVLLKAPEKYSGSFVIRQILQVAYLVLVYFIGSKTQIADLAYHVMVLMVEKGITWEDVMQELSQR